MGVRRFVGALAVFSLVFVASPAGAEETEPVQIIVEQGYGKEGDQPLSPTYLEFRASLSRASSDPVSFSFETASNNPFVEGRGCAGTCTFALPLIDYLEAAGSVVFGPGDSTPKSFFVPIVGDDVAESPLEYIEVNLWAPVNGVFAGTGPPWNAVTQREVIGLIADDDPGFIVEGPEFCIIERNKGFSAATFTVNLSVPSDETVSVGYATHDHTANAPDDYQAAAGRVSFAPGETSKNVSVSVVGDRMVEPNESFTLDLSNPVGGEVFWNSGSAEACIADDDGGRR